MLKKIIFSRYSSLLIFIIIPCKRFRKMNRKLYQRTSKKINHSLSTDRNGSFYLSKKKKKNLATRENIECTRTEQNLSTFIDRRNMNLIYTRSVGVLPRKFDWARLQVE